jgi:Putative prokaryotic signal transducing protein
VNVGSPADLVEVAFAGDPGEAGMIQGLLEGAGIPSLLQPTGIDGTKLGIGLLPPGSQRVLVRAEHAADARRLLADTLGEGGREVAAGEAAESLGEAGGPREYGLIGAYARIWLWSLAALAGAFGLFLLLRIV